MKVVLAVIASKSHEAFLLNWKSIKVPENMKVFYIFGSKEAKVQTLEEQQAHIDAMNSLISTSLSIEDALNAVNTVTRQKERDDLSEITRTMGKTELRNGCELWVDCPECISPGIHLKTKAAFEYLLENEEFDILIRPNLSSLFHLEKLYKWLLNKPRQGASFGHLTFGSFLSGCGYGLTRDIVEDFVKTEFSAQEIMTEIDDMNLHKYLTAKAVPRHCWELEFYENGRPLVSSHFHLRFKTGDRAQDALAQSKYIQQVLNNDS